MTFFSSGSTSTVGKVNKTDNVNKTVKKQTLQIETAEKWKTTFLVQYDTENWLSIQPDNNKKLVKTICCKLCCEYENYICGLPQFNYTWSKDGCVHLHLSVAAEHATGGPHKVACNKFLTKKRLGPREGTSKVSGWHETRQMSLVKSFDIAQSANFEKNKMKFETAYFITNFQLPISKFKKIHALEVKHGMQLGKAYTNDTSAGVMVDFIGDSIVLDLKNTLENRNFFSLLTDGSTDASVTKKEAIFVVVLNPTPHKTNEIKVEIISL